MQLIRRGPAHDEPLWHFLKTVLPPSLECLSRQDNYAQSFYVCAINRRSWFGSGEIASVDRLHVRLRAPEYVSDFQDALAKFEKLTGRETTLEYWES